MSKNDYNNLKNIFDKCNLKIEKVLIKSFIESVYINNKHNVETFFLIKINNHNSKISFFENGSLKFEQVFNFGKDIVFSDISKITYLNRENVKHILEKINLVETLSEDEIIEKEFFSDDNYRKIKKKLIYEIAYARIQEISELIIFKNINLKYHNKVPKKIFLDIKGQPQEKGLNKIFESAFSLNNKLDLKLITDSSNDNLIRTTNYVHQYGWKKEAIPVALYKKSILKRFFEAIFG